MYCINCGVKLADTEQRCPLCGVTVYHPELKREEAQPLYPKRDPIPQVSSKAAQIVVTTLLLIALLTTLFVDLQISGKVTWSGIVAGALLVGYAIAVMPFWFRKVKAEVYLPAVFVSVGLYLQYINAVTGGDWFLGFAFPLTAFLGVLITAQVLLLSRWPGKVLTILGGGLISLGAFMPLLEYLICLSFPNARFVAWSVYPLISLSLLGAMLIFLAVNRKAREKMERKFFL